MVKLLLVLSFVGLGLAVKPEPPRGVIGQKKLATAVDCSGPVGFSVTGANTVHQTGLISYSKTLVDRGVGFSRETGEFTVHCPGIYSVAFSAYRNTPNTKLILKKRGSGEQQWTEVAYAGGESSTGGSNQVLLELEVGDQTGVWLTGADSATGNPPLTTFTAFRIAKK